MAGMSFEEYVQAYYGGTLGIAKRYGIRKADDTFETTDPTGAFNTMYGAAVFNQLNTKSEVFKLLKKEAWTQSGWSALTARHTTTKALAEGAAFGDTDKPDLAEVSATLKEIVTPWEVTTKAELLSEADDGIKGILNFLRTESAEAHSYYIDDMLTKSAEANSDGSTGAGLAGVNFESLDRVTADSDYAADAQSPCNSQDDCDMYGLDITSETWFNAGYTHFTGDGTNNALALSDIDEGISSLLENGLDYNNLILLTGYDTYQNLKQLMQATTGAAWNYNLAGAGAGSENGVTGEAGLNFDSRVGAYDGIPIFLSQHIPKDGASRIYMLDSAALAMRIAAPTTYVDNQNLAVLQKLSKEFAFVTAGELIAYQRSTSGSIRDLTA